MGFHFIQVGTKKSNSGRYVSVCSLLNHIKMHVKKFSEKAQNICDRELPVNRRHHTVKHVITAAIQATCNIIHHCFTLRRRFRNRLYLLPLCWNNQQVVSKHTAPLQDPKWNCFQQYPLPQVREKSVALSKPEEASRY